LGHCSRQRVGAKLVFALLGAASRWAITRIAPTRCANLLWSDLASESAPYNCVAYGLHDTQQWWEYGPIPVRGYYWPPGVRQDNSIESWIQVYEIHGYRRCDNTDLEQGIEKVAFYVKDGEPQHVARQLESGVWISKLGPDEDIEHNTLEGLVGETYGKVEIIMKRLRK